MLGRICDANWRTPNIHRSKVFKVSMIMRRPTDRRWSLAMIKAVVGTPGQPMLGSSQRKLAAFARKAPEAQSEKPTYVPMPAAEAEPRQAKVQAADIDAHGPSEKCPGCRAYKGGKYGAKHTNECRKRFESLLAESVRGRRRFEAAREKQLDGISRKAMEMEGAIETEAPAVASGSAASGSGQTPAEKQSDVARQNAEELQKGLAASMGEIPTGKPAAARPRTSFKRKAPDADIDDSRLDPARSQGGEDSMTTVGGVLNGQGPAAGAQSSEAPAGIKRRAEDQSADASRSQDRGDDMSSATVGHPGPVNHGGTYPKGDLEWRHIGTGVFARTFPRISRLVTTTRRGPRLEDIHRRIVRSLTTGKVICDCVVDGAPHKERNRYLNEPDDVRIELIMKGALAMYQTKGVDVSEIFSQPRIVQEAAMHSHKGIKLKPGWSLDLTREDPLTGKPWDLGKASVRRRVRALVQDTEPFMVIGSPPCTLFCAMQNLSKGNAMRPSFMIN